MPSPPVTTVPQTYIPDRPTRPRSTRSLLEWPPPYCGRQDCFTRLQIIDGHIILFSHWILLQQKAFFFFDHHNNQILNACSILVDINASVLLTRTMLILESDYMFSSCGYVLTPVSSFACLHVCTSECCILAWKNILPMENCNVSIYMKIKINSSQIDKS